jgi:hypothetical protein
MPRAVYTPVWGGSEHKRRAKREKIPPKAELRMSRNRYRFRVRLMNSLRKLTSESMVAWVCWMVLRGIVTFVAIEDTCSCAGQGDATNFSGMEVQVWEWRLDDVVLICSAVGNDGIVTHGV